MKILVTGATGFIGYHAARALQDGEHTLRALVRDEGKGARVLEPLGVAATDRVAGDMTDAASVEKALDGCDALVHAAAGVSVTTGAQDFAANVTGTEVVLGAAFARELPCVYLSSLEAIMQPGRPTTEASEPVMGATHYGRSKARADRWVREQAQAGAGVTILYPPGVVGPDDPGFSESVKAYRSFLRGTLRVGATQFVDGRDLGILIRRLLETRHAGRVLAGGHFFTWDALTDLLVEVTGARIPRISAPGWLLRGAARTMDVIGRVTGRKMPMTGEGIEIATRWQRVADSPVVAELGVGWRDPEETLRDLFRWYVEAGRLPAKAVPKLGGS
ncbi:MAG: NAD-dependent epimerase/dehydratase family protein [Myxococcota bacterium]